MNRQAMWSWIMRGRAAEYPAPHGGEAGWRDIEMGEEEGLREVEEVMSMEGRDYG